MAKETFKIKFKSFDELRNQELYALLQLRQEIFVIEQNCIYQDLDNMDQLAQHLLVYQKKELIAYARIFPPKIAFKEITIGRIISKTHGLGHGSMVVKTAIEKAYEKYGKNPIRIGAQCYATGFYEKFGFKVAGEPYLEDEIPHVEMVLTPL